MVRVGGDRDRKSGKGLYKKGKLTIEVDRKLKQFYIIYIVERHVDSGNVH